jgi:hypothetical protein
VRDDKGNKKHSSEVLTLPKPYFIYSTLHNIPPAIEKAEAAHRKDANCSGPFILF